MSASAGASSSSATRAPTAVDTQDPDTTEYHVVVNIDKISNLWSGGWDVTPNDTVEARQFVCELKDPSRPCTQASKPRRVIGVVGWFNKGKTFLVKKLTGANLQSMRGAQGNTKPLSILYHQDNTVYVDSAGMASPVRKVDFAQFESQKNGKIAFAAAHRKATDNFIQDIIFSVSDKLLFVVSDFTSADQEMLFNMWERLKTATDHIIVVHNFRHYTYQQAKKAFTARVLPMFTGPQTRKDNDGIELVTKCSTHVFLCNDEIKKEEEQLHNARTIRIIARMIQLVEPREKLAKSLPQRLLNGMKTHAEQYIGSHDFHLVSREKESDTSTAGAGEVSGGKTPPQRESWLLAPTGTDRSPDDYHSFIQGSFKFFQFRVDLKRHYAPDIGFFVTDDHFWVEIDIPGVKNDKEHLRVSRQGDLPVYTVWGERPEKPTNSSLPLVKTKTGQFNINFTVPQLYDAKKKTVSLQGGILLFKFEKKVSPFS